MHIIRSMGFIQLLTGLLLVAFAGMLFAAPDPAAFLTGMLSLSDNFEGMPDTTEQIEQLDSMPGLESVGALYAGMASQLALIWAIFSVVALVLVMSLATLLMTQGVVNIRHGFDEAVTTKAGHGFQLAIALLTVYLVIQFFSGSVMFGLFGVLLSLGIFVGTVVLYQKNFTK